MFGAQKGDELLRGVYECIKSGLTEGEPAARVDADHFAFHLVERQRSAVLERLRQIERRIRRLSDKMGVIHLVPRFGVYAMRPEEDARRACELANLALGAARSSADNTVAFYQDLDQNAFFENMQLEDRFDEAIGEHQFKAYYQPKCNPKTGEIVGGEALVRWVQEDGTMLSPARFIPLFEKNGDIIKLDKYVLEETCAKIRKWLDLGYDVSPISVNVSLLQLLDENFVEDHIKTVEKYGIPLNLIEIEFTESILAENESLLISLTKQCKKHGIKVLLDDFGSGYSSLNMLNLLPCDIVKLDKRFVDKLETDDKSKAIVLSAISLAHTLQMSVTAEGVETKNQYDLLKEMHCDKIQGFYCAKPMPEDDYENLIKG